MIEIRAVEGALGERVRLEYRFVTPNVDASGASIAIVSRVAMMVPGSNITRPVIRDRGDGEASTRGLFL